MQHLNYTKIAMLVALVFILLFVVLYIVYLFLSRTRGARARSSGRAREGEYIGIVFDETGETYDVPLVSAGMDVLVTPEKYRGKPLIVFKLERAKPLRKDGRLAYVVFAKGVFGYAVPEDMLLKLGLSKITINDEKWDSNNPLTIVNLIEDILAKGKETTGEVTLSNDMKIGFTISIPQVVSALVEMVGRMGISNLKALEEKIVESKKLAEKMRPKEIGINFARALIGLGFIVFMIAMFYFLAKYGVIGGRGGTETQQIIQTTTTILQNITGGG